MDGEVIHSITERFAETIANDEQSITRTASL